MIEINILFLLVVGIFVGGAAGFLGSFMVLKRMALVGDAFTHPFFRDAADRDANQVHACSYGFNRPG